jgi:DNA-binding protein HU-beta
VNKTELAEQIAQRAGVSGAEAGRVLDATLQTIEAALASGDEVTITGFGKFTVADRAARQGVNPATGEPIAIAASKAPRFSAGAKLKQAVKA